MLFANETAGVFQAPTVYHAFMYGCVGSLAAEVALFSKAFGTRGAITDKKYTSRLYWFVRIMLALLAGIIATAAFNPSLNPFVYVYLGISTPGLLSRGASTSGQADSDGEDED